MVLFRASSGRPVALADRCVHRHFPLSQSQLVGDTIVCGYHGFTYGTDGRCVAVPGQQRIPRTARVTSYPLAELDSFVWIWIGDPDRADATLIPRAPWLADERYTTVAGMQPLAARYGLLVDNLLDLSHETYLHGGYIGTPEVADTPITTEVDDARGIIRVSRRMADAACPPFYAESTGITGRIVRWQDIEYRPPCLYLLHSRVAQQRGAAPAGRHRPGRVPRRGGVREPRKHRQHRGRARRARLGAGNGPIWRFRRRPADARIGSRQAEQLEEIEQTWCPTRPGWTRAASSRPTWPPWYSAPTSASSRRRTAPRSSARWPRACPSRSWTTSACRSAPPEAELRRYVGITR